MLRIVQNGRILFCSHGLKIRAIGVNVFILLWDKDFNSGNGKRPIMAKEAAKASDRVIITSDNPRFEEPQDIINDMLAGLDAEDMKKTLSIADRKEAIRTACMLAEKGDVILVAGKGHENYQEIKGVKHHFDDKEVLKEIFK
jgi:UDP-N-acetylmuramoyl-L-alanyl-D-glutamate--2,6-diaminopimelate ligase